MTYLSTGFLGFLADLDAHNDRDWFQAHKARYERDVRDPFLAFLRALAPELERVAPGFVVDPRPVGGSMMRLHRDTRFSKDKRPYKTSVAAGFWRADAAESAPGFHLSLKPGASGVGGGWWRPEAGTVRRIRDAIVAQPERWRTVTADVHANSACGFHGESLKRVPPGYPADHPLADDLKRKDFAVHRALADEVVTSDRLLPAVVDALAATAPFVAFLEDAISG